MDPFSPLPALAAILAAVCTAFAISRLYGAPPSQGRFASIDGLRGYLAFFVFLHHASIWYGYLKTGIWEAPPSPLYAHFGGSSVALFFMITGFLFFSKLLEGRKTPIDWGKLFVGRLLRLTPLYFFAVFLLFLVVTALSHARLQEPLANVLLQATQWIGFTVTGKPNVNGVHDTSIILAGVTWSLPYEWLYYLSLPLLALLVGVIPPLPYFALGLLSRVWLALWQPPGAYLLCFLGGMAAAILVRWERFRRFSGHPLASVFVLACIGTTFTMFSYTYGRIPLLLLFLAFSLIAAGNTLFGALTHAVSRTLGEYAYSLYLLHGITLFVVFHFVIGTAAAKAFLPETHWLVVVAITPFMVCLCALTFRFIEKPPMQKVAAATAWLRSRCQTLVSSSPVDGAGQPSGQHDQAEGDAVPGKHHKVVRGDVAQQPADAQPGA